MDFLDCVACVLVKHPVYCVRIECLQQRENIQNTLNEGQIHTELLVFLPLAPAAALYQAHILIIKQVLDLLFR